jgi:uncharacterized protein YqhQ
MFELYMMIVIATYFGLGAFIFYLNRHSEDKKKKEVEKKIEKKSEKKKEKITV